MSQIQDGTYEGRILNYGIEETAKGDPRVIVEFQVTDAHGRSTVMRWGAGFYSAQGTEITLKTLANMGLRSGDDVKYMADGLASRTLDASRSYDLVIENKPHWNNKDKTVAEIRGVYRKGEAPVKREIKTLDTHTAASKLSALNLGASFKKAVVETSSPDPSKIPF